MLPFAIAINFWVLAKAIAQSPPKMYPLSETGACPRMLLVTVFSTLILNLIAKEKGKQCPFDFENSKYHLIVQF